MGIRIIRKGRPKGMKQFTDPGLSIHGPQSQTVGAAKTMRGRLGTVPGMRAAASRNPSRWATGKVKA